MQGTIAQSIALTTYGNVFLTGSPKFDLSNFYPTSSTFMFCEYVRFVDLIRKGESWEESEYASDPIAWFQMLKNDGVSALRLDHGSTGGQNLGAKTVSDRMLVGFVGGGGRWLIEAMKPGASDFWEARWEVGDRERKDQKIWRVTYGRIASGQPMTERTLPDMLTLRSRLADNLQAIGTFARNQKMDEFAEAFDAGLSALTSYDPNGSGYELAPDSALPPSAMQLLNATQAAWVFGGMGSWNDVGFEGDDQRNYERLSEELYQLLNAAIVTAANAGTPSSPGKQSKPWWKLWN